MIHTPVLLNEILSIFCDIKSGIILDATIGYGGHTKALLDQNPNIKIIGNDRDEEAFLYSKNLLKNYGDRIEIYKGPFSEILSKIDISNIRGILADIGISSLQINKNDRGFSTKSKTLDMRMDKTQILDAKFVVNNYSFDDLVRIFRDFGEIKDAKNLADKIVKYRAKRYIESGVELAEILGPQKVRKNSVSKATLAFQAIRIEVNKELEELTNLLTSIEKAKFKDCILAIISFHSLEDRIIKNRFKKWEKSCICPDFFIKCECGNNHALGKILTKKAITPSQKEIKLNSRSKSSKLRAFKIYGK
ncbi:16S rRNA (cytosine(1402)-N(4))-methyltransferase RsmH [Campylobacter sp. FMV-PI01]|uniref:Ribosomal RNA small subunit methyltransferase H n=1 Tax=Campylobacter portucalensis TaxID=2608384 RepID=A0A6L5WJS2_9BACT|nr:16S rRNA (cytosine(1402)-N(4))-methyltransferase RsmH [Campylobacter portucalensis]MSN96275.1 16S rRNA (cytosine(1402)-N(4))-methyltransferase RsmH [Campylobacter portucalensis]